MTQQRRSAHPTGSAPQVGVALGSLTPPEALAGGSRLAEELGFSELWFSEDFFFTGAMSGLSRMLDETVSIPVGLGLASTQTRHPALLAMELAGLARTHPGRVRATLGLGNTHWLRQMGLLPDRPLSALLEDFGAVRSLLAGGTVTKQGGPGHAFDDVTLSFPPAEPPPLGIGAVNERALRAAGAHADGVLLSVLTGPAYLRWARGLVAEGAAAAGRPAPPISAFVLASVDDDADRARRAVADAVEFFVRAESHTALVTRSELPDAGREPAAWSDATRVEHVRTFAAAGTPDETATRLRSLFRAGARSLGLWLFPSDELEVQLHRVAELVLPRLGVVGR